MDFLSQSSAAAHLQRFASNSRHNAGNNALKCVMRCAMTMSSTIDPEMAARAASLADFACFWLWYPCKEYNTLTKMTLYHSRSSLEYPCLWCSLTAAQRPAELSPTQIKSHG